MESSRRVLSVEDDKFLSSLVARKLSAAGFVMSHASSGEDALKMIKEDKPALVLLDILLPEMSGFEVLEKIKSDPMIKDTPVILFSNLGQKEDVDKGLKLGAEKFIIKATVVLDDSVREIEQFLGSPNADQSETGQDYLSEGPQKDASNDIQPSDTKTFI